MATESITLIIPSLPNHRVAIKQMLKHISDSYTRIEGERDAIKEFIAEITETYDIPKKYVTQLAKVYHKLNMSQIKQENADFEELYSAIVESTTEKTGE